MIDLPAPGLPILALMPATVCLLLLLVPAFRLAGSTSGRFVIFACWLRFMLSSFHVYTFRPVFGPFSGNALGSASLFLLGLALIPASRLFTKGLRTAYLVVAAILVSGVASESVLSVFEPLTKLGLVVVLALHTARALQSGNEKSFIGALILSFAPLLLLQLLSILFNVPKSTEGAGGDSYIGGYYHEAAFSIAIVGLLAVVLVAQTLPKWLTLLVIPLGILSILLANYRTAILAAAPLLIYYFLHAIGRAFDPKLRSIVVVLACAATIVGAGVTVATVDRFHDLQVVAREGTALIKPPDEFNIEEHQLLSGRFELWSAYIYKWRDGNQAQQLVGYGPESWPEYFDLYAHNTFIDFLFEYGLIGLGAICIFFAAGLLAALKAQRNRWKLFAAQSSFLALNLATMPLWLVEGNLVYGLLWGFTLFYGSQNGVLVVRRAQAPMRRLAPA